ncbi:hypothetical protein [Pseudomonas chlororaphis]|uniref:hypothetical protein n=1 Tax=Pseudomonas chlororaphis TaxID=587753 RepID=UPI000D0F7F33|nr:hypothetical protein [Pseudomonas chlororaphis]AVO58346.1 hypothetical protein C6Q18_10380 [Pseudomonas chlororaphis subsp. piscium]WDG50324.1 hypothetical protein PUP58_11265 [Pseudomonas chlororaphis]
MTVETLLASTQYSDLKGGAAADRADNGGPSEWLRQNGHITDDEFVVGIDFSVGENHGVHRDPVYVSFLIVETRGFDNVAAHIAALPADEPVEVRNVSVDMALVDFFALFKRFNVTLTPIAAMEGRAYRYAD